MNLREYWKKWNDDSFGRQYIGEAERVPFLAQKLERRTLSPQLATKTDGRGKAKVSARMVRKNVAGTHYTSRSNHQKGSKKTSSLLIIQKGKSTQIHSR